MSLSKENQMEHKNSLVSICVPTYNSAKFLKQCLDSIVTQTYANKEVIISDNASTDETVSIIQEYVKKYGFKLNVNATNIGAGENFNKLISLANGDYIAIYHADDVYQKTIVEECAQVLDNDESIPLVGTMGNIIAENGVAFNSMRLPKHLQKLNKTVYNFDQALSGLLKRGWFFATPTVMVRKKVYDRVGVFDCISYKSCGDYAFWLKIAHAYNRLAILNKRLFNYRVHQNQGTELEIRKNPEVADLVLVLQQYKEFAKDRKVKQWTDDCINANIIKAARRQNYYGLFEKSNATLRKMYSRRAFYLLQKFGIQAFNLFLLPIKKRSR